MTREIPLSQGFVALVDDEDYERVVAAGKWHAYHSRNTFYAARNRKRSDGTRVKIALHTFLTGWPLVDHRNGNGLDDRRSNLREVTCAENARNARRWHKNTSGFKGVSPDRGRWCARIRANGRNRYLGLYDTPEEAARAYDRAARESYGEFACLNFPQPGERGALEIANGGDSA